MIEIPRERRAAYLRNCRILAVASTILAVLYLKWLLVDARPENHFLYWLLVSAELFNIVQAAGFWYTISMQRWSEPAMPDFALTSETVDLFVTVLGEPVDVVERTVAAALAVRHPRSLVYVLDDGRSPEVAGLAARLGAGYITREDLSGAKAGNVNHALSVTRGSLFAIFDADQAPHPDFLEATLGAFSEPSVAFVQTPQVYRNRDSNRVAEGAHAQQGLFYGPIMRGKDGCRAVFSCGTNIVYRRSSIKAIGGLPEDSITEDLRGSLLLIRRGFTSVYVAKVLADGLGPLDVRSYFGQQLRWGRGGLEILFKRHPFSRHMTAPQAVQYGLGFMYWFTGLAYLAYLALPMAYLTAGLRPVQVPNDYPVHFLPYVLAALATIIYASDFRLSFAALWFTLASFPVQIRALFSTFFGRRAAFVVTPKKQGALTLRPVVVQMTAIAALAGASVYGILRFGAIPSVVNNVAWAIAHIVVLLGFVRLSLRPHKALHVAEGLAKTTLMLVLCAVLVAGMAGCSLVENAGPVGGSATSPSRPATSTAAAPLPLAGKVAPLPSSAYLGVYVPPAPFDPSALDAFEAKAGKRAAIVMWYQPWAASNRSRFDTAAVVAIMRRGKIPMITWEPWDPGANANTVRHPGVQPSYRLAAINAGVHDDYIRTWARDIRALGGPVMLRPMHEMNGNWYPWSGTSNGNTPAQYVAAWRRLHDIFEHEGATNVTWVWSVNHASVPRNDPRNTFAAYYPGGGYVDWVAVSGFNWGAAPAKPGWATFPVVYDSALAFLRTMGKPICIAEFASVEQGGSKAAWIRDAYSRISKDRTVKAIVYFDSLEEGAGTQDWRVDTSPASLAAFRAAIAPSHFVAATPSELTTWVDRLDARQWKYLASFDPIY